MFFRSKPIPLATLWLLLSVPFFLMGCGGGGGSSTSSNQPVSSVSIYPTEIPSTGGTVLVSAVAPGSIGSLTATIDGVSATLMSQGSGIYSANLIIPANQGSSDQKLAATITGKDVSNNAIQPLTTENVTVYATGTGKPNATLWGYAKASSGDAVAVSAVSVKSMTDSSTVSPIKVDTRSSGGFQFAFNATLGTTYLVRIDAVGNYWPCQKLVKITQSGLVKLDSVTMTSKDNPPPPPPMEAKTY